MFADPVSWSITSVRPPDQADGWGFNRWTSRVRGAPEVLGQYPVSCLAEEIATPGEGRIRALVVIAGNPVISAPESDRLDAALPQLDAMISIDNWVNETSRHAHVILPGLSALEQPHYDDLIWSFATRNAANFSRRRVPAPAGPPRRVGDPAAGGGDHRRAERRPTSTCPASTTATSSASSWPTRPRRARRSPTGTRWTSWRRRRATGPSASWTSVCGSGPTARPTGRTRVA